MDIGTIITLVQAGVTTFQQIKSAHDAGSIEMTDEQLNQLADAMVAEDNRRAQKAAKIARGDFS